MNRIRGVMISMLASNVVYRWFDPQSGQTKDYIIGMGSSHYSDSHNSDSYFSDTHNSDSHYSDTH
jgi:hypothetical protein